MHLRMRSALPLTQVIIAATLIASNFRQSPRIDSWTFPDRQFCDGLNAPAALVRSLLDFGLWQLHLHVPSLVTSGFYGRGEFILETAIYLTLIAFLWYFVGIEIGSSHRGSQSVLTADI